MSGEDETGGVGRGRGLGSRYVRRGQTARAAIRSIRATQKLLKLAGEVLLAAIIVFEEWGWQPLAAGLASLARIRAVARLEAAVLALPPWPALAVFLVPSLLFLPLKLLALWLIASGNVLLATGVFIFAKIGGTALYARIFQLTKPALMQLSWFAAAYNVFMPWKERLIAQARNTALWQRGVAVKAELASAVRPVWLKLRAAMPGMLARLRAALARR
ncbi:MAG: hypothetical protein R3D67_12360 [Hyphomicrobiaceae bacterium]